jgi:signal transduction histidine kinase
VLSLTAIARHARGPDWRAGSTSVPRRPDVLVLAAAVACAAVIVILHALGGWQNYASLLNPLALLIGFVVLIPFAVRNLGGLIVALLTNLCTLAGLGTIGGGAGLLAARLGPDLRLVPVVVAAAALVVVTGVGRRALHDAIDAIVFRRTRDRWARLTALLRGISPEAGTLECARRALDALVREAHLRASALLFRDGAAVVSGDLDLGRVARLWPKGEAADALLARASYHDDLQILPAELREATIDANIVCIAPIRGSRRPWGHLVLSTDLVGSTFFDEDIQGIEAFNAQLALIFDAADMLERVVAVERSLAHAEKLAAIGELAARIAHEIRNPVTAARSLAQTLSREPTSPLNAEHAELILTELERVERQVAALLRFARREEFHFENADVGSLVRETAQHFEARLAGANVGCTVDAPDGIVARVDRDKLRQVLINLVENALDAVADRAGERRIALTVSARNGSSTVRVEDSGPGIPEDALARIFEPFFSLKAQGTGLGLAIVKRTVEAHGGRVHASSSRDGAAFEIELPLMNPTGVPRSGGRA